ncbi:MAG: hypothetical protein ACRDDX_06800 [Cellulosilyticaceae bacterium]
MGNEALILLRTKSIKFFKTYEKWLIGVAKYLGVVLVLALINQRIGYMEPLTRSYVVIGIAALSMFLSNQSIQFIIMGIVAVHLMVFNLVIGMSTFVAFVILYIAFIRLYPKESMLIIGTMLAFVCKCEYILLFIGAALGTYACGIAIGIGVIGSYCSQAVQVVVQSTDGSKDLLAMGQQFAETLIGKCLMNPNMLGTLVIFLIVFTGMYWIKKQAVDYAPYIALTIGVVMSLLGVGLGVIFLKMQVQLGQQAIITCIGGVITAIVLVMYKPLDYSRAEVVQFEDEENVYYVKVVPKFCMHLEPKKVEQIYTTNKGEQKEML